ncbi:hypothetical protein ACM257_17505 [Alteromonas macleodii]|uniref:hypothetical protein n=1 Tax=Alteromonas macleodii TaxID=28108 RepID=UPI0039F656A0
MEALFISFGIGVMSGYFICMFKVTKLQNQISKMRIDALHESNKDALLRKLCAGQSDD